MPGKPPRDLTTAAGLLIEAANYLQRGMHADVEHATGLPGAWLEVLLRLHRTPGGAMRINEMASQVTLPASSFSRLADRMEEQGLVHRRPDPAHRRATLLGMTPSGQRRFAEAWRVLEPSQQARFGRLLTDQELDALETITRKIRDANRLVRARSNGPPALNGAEAVDAPRTARGRRSAAEPQLLATRREPVQTRGAQRRV
jgi:DNA-binding MarR family transcriptional regulator